MGFRTIAAAALAGTALVPVLASGAVSMQTGVASVPARNSSWTHERSDLKPDPAGRFGKLPNGMRYVVYRNVTPPGQVSIRFRFDAGDLMETDDQNGLAHFIEHMAFNGTTNVKEGEILKMLERHGLMFGRDVNAFTAPDQTAYVLDIPAVSDAKLDTAFLFMRELAGEMTFDQKAIDDERGIIVSEDRSMYPAVRRALVEKDRFLLKDQLISKRLDIGDLNVIRSAKRDRFVNYYDKFYRPERATLIVVGDVEPEKIEAEIKQRFGDWRAKGQPGAEPDLGKLAQRGFEAASTVSDGALREVSLNWLRSYVDEPDNRAERIERWRERLALAVLNRRLKRVVEAGSAPFTSGSVGTSRRYRSVEQTSFSVNPVPGREAEATAVIEQEARRAAEHGLRQSELEREIVEARSALQAAVAAAATRQTPQLANQILGLVSIDQVLLTPSEELALFEEAVRGFGAAEASGLVKTQFTGSGPLLYAMSPDSIAGGHQALAAAHGKSRVAAVSMPMEATAKAWTYTSFGKLGRVAERSEIADLGVTKVRFENGVTLLVKPTKLQNDQVLVTARAAGGTLARKPNDDMGSMQIMVQGGFVGGGIEGYSEEELKQALAGKRYSAMLAPGENAYALRGETTTADFSTQMQVLAAYMTKPAWRPDVYQRKKSEFLNIYNVINTMPMNVAMMRYPSLVRSGDRRFGLPPVDAIKQGTLAAARAEIEPSFKNAPVEIIIVGDLTVEEAIAQTAATFGALPKRSEKAPVAAGADKIAFAKMGGAPQRLEHSGRSDVALGLISWPTDDFHDNPAEARGQAVLRSALHIRALERIREQLGASYSPQAFQESSEIFDEFGLLTLLAEVNPSETPRLLATFDEVAEELKANPLPGEELARAVRPLIDQIDKDMATNNFWATRLASASWDPRRLDIIRTQKQHLEKITSADIQRLAQKYLRKDLAFRLLVEPGKQPQSPATGTRTVISRPSTTQ